MHTLPPWRWPRAAYIHIPFCAHHCGYCDFAVSAGKDHLIDRYVDALIMELATLCQPEQVNTIFLGGGTPTYLEPRQLAKLLDAVNRWLPLNPAHEFSVEATPESITPEKIDVLADHGVNRISLGVQSFDTALLPVLDRIHGPQHVGPAIEAIRRRIDRFSLDLIFGIPGQSLAQWKSDLQMAITFEPEHISTYGLTYEKGTPLWKARERGRVIPLGESDELAMYDIAMDTLAATGFEHYEISNFARPGGRCRHNEVYWANHAYFGFGVGAARYVQGRRELNTRSLEGYMKAVLAGESAIFQSEELGEEDRAGKRSPCNFAVRRVSSGMPTKCRQASIWICCWER